MDDVTLLKDEELEVEDGADEAKSDILADGLVDPLTGPGAAPKNADDSGESSGQPLVSGTVGKFTDEAPNGDDEDEKSDQTAEKVEPPEVGSTVAQKPAGDPDGKADVPSKVIGFASSRSGLKSAILSMESERVARVRFMASTISRDLRIKTGTGVVRLNRKGKIVEVLSFSGTAHWLRDGVPSGLVRLSSLLGKPKLLTGAGSFQLSERLALPTRRGVAISLPEGQVGDCTIWRSRMGSVSANVDGVQMLVDLEGTGKSAQGDSGAPDTPADRKELKEEADGNKALSFEETKDLGNDQAQVDFLPSKVPFRRMWVLDGEGTVQKNHRKRIDNVINAQMRLTWMHRLKTQGELSLTGVHGKPSQLTGKGSFVTTREMTLPGKRSPTVTLGIGSELGATVTEGKLRTLEGSDIDGDVERWPEPEPPNIVNQMEIGDIPKDIKGGAPRWMDLNPEFYPTRDLVYQTGRALCNMKGQSDRVKDIIQGFGSAIWQSGEGAGELVNFESLSGGPKKVEMMGDTALTSAMDLKNGNGLELTTTADAAPMTLTVTKGKPTLVAGSGFGISATSNSSELYALTTRGSIALNKGRAVNGSAGVSFSRRPEPIAKNRGPASDWNVWLEPPAGKLPSVTIDDSKLSELSGAVTLSVDKGGEQIFVVTGSGAQYGPHDAPEVTVLGADLDMKSSVDLVTFDTIRLGLGIGTGGTISLDKNDITRLGGTLPFYLDNATGRYLEGVLTGQYADGVFSGAGSMTLLQNQALGGKSGEDGWTIGLTTSTGLTATIVSNALTEMSGVLNMAVASGPKTWATLKADGTYIHAERDFTGGATIDVVSTMSLFEHNDLEYFIDAGSTAAVTVENSALTSFSAGKIKLLVHEGDALWVSGGVSDVMYTRADNNLSGTIGGEVHKDVTRGMRNAADPNTVLVHTGTKATVKMTESAFERMDVTSAAISLHLEEVGGGPVDVKGTLAGGMSQQDDGLLVEDLTGSVNLTKDWQVTERIRLTKGSGLDSLTVEDNELQEVSGNIGAVVADEAGVDFASGQLAGSWSAETGLVEGYITGTLLQDVTKTLSGDLAVTLHSGANARVDFEGGGISTISGKAIRATLTDGGEDLLTAEVSGTYNLAAGILESLTVTADLLKTFTFFNERMSLTGVSAAIQITNNVLVLAKGSASVESTDMMIRKATVSFEWSQTSGGVSNFAFAGTAAWVAWQDSDSSLKGSIALDYRSFTDFDFLGTAHYKMTEGALAAGMSIEFDETLNPTIGGYLHYATTLLDQSTLFDKEWGVDIPILSVGIATAWFGAEIGIGLDSAPLTFDGKASIANWRPFEQSAPDFDMTAKASWGLTFHARVAAHLEAGIQLAIAGAGLGAEAGIGLNMPLTLTPMLNIFGDKDGFGGTVGIDIGLSASVIFDASLYYFADLLMGWLGEYEGVMWEDSMEFPLFDTSWGGDFAFGDAKPKKKSPRVKVEGVPAVTAEEKSMTKGDMPAPGTVKTSKKDTVTDNTEKKKLPGKAGDEVDLGSAFGGDEKKGDSVFPSSFDQFFQGGDVAAMWDAFEAIQRFWDRLGIFFEILLSPATGIVRFAKEWYKEDGLFSGSSLADDVDAVEKGLVAAGKLISGMGANEWDTWYRVGQVVAGKMSLYEAYMGSDDAVMEAIDGGAYKKMEGEELGSMLEVLCAGDTACVGDKEWGVLKILRLAEKKGCLYTVLSDVSGTYTGANQVLWKLEGSTDAEAVEIFDRNGIYWSYF